MSPSRLHLGVNHEACAFSLDIPLSPLERWFEQLTQRVAVMRAREEGEGYLMVRVLCPGCGAQAHHLGRTDAGRICHSCGTEFSPTVPPCPA